MRKLAIWFIGFILLAISGAYSIYFADRNSPGKTDKSSDERHIVLLGDDYSAQQENSTRALSHLHAQLNTIEMECRGCHFASRDTPIRGLSQRNIGLWNDQQCYGCHREFNTLAQIYLKNPDDPRFVMFPLPEKKLVHISANPLSYGHAPENIGVWVDGVQRINFNDLHRYLKSPVRVKRSYFTQDDTFKVSDNEPIRMPAYPKLSQQDVKILLGKLYPDIDITDEKFAEGDKENAAEKAAALEPGEPPAVWKDQCATCHTGDNPGAGINALNLSLYSSDWIFAYANGISRHPRIEVRKMPVFSISRQNANSLKQYFDYLRTSREKQLESALGKALSINTTEKGSTGQQLPQQLSFYIWNNFFRDAACVHCHSAEGRAKAQLDLTTINSFKQWLKKNDPNKIWQRLETRAHEQRYGVGAEIPGMPMAGSTLPQEARRLIKIWIEQGCIDPEGALQCPNDRI